MSEENDEIDIEEHDVLDNPTIRKIFPDLSIIKKEIIQYEEGLSSTLEDTAQDAYVDTSLDAKPTTIQPHIQLVKPAECKRLVDAQQASVNHRLEVHLRFKTFLDSLDDVFENTDINSVSKLGADGQHLNGNSSTNPQMLYKTVNTRNNYTKCLQNNIFILGSKPSVSQPKRTPRAKRQLKIVLKNIYSYLNDSKRYCGHCLILFPNVDAMLCHMSKVHSSSTDNSIINKKEPLVQKADNTKFQCDICAVWISSKGNLQRHIKRIHKMQVRTTKKSNKLRHKTRCTLKQKLKFNQSKISLKGNVRTKGTSMSVTKDTRTKSNEKHTCFHCPQIFETQSSLIEHLYNIISPSKQASDNSERSVQTAEIQDTNNDKCKDDLTKSENIECSGCTIEFTSQSELDQHNLKKHTNLDKLQSNMDISNDQNNSVKENDCASEVKCYSSLDPKNNLANDNKQKRSTTNSQSLTKKNVYQCFVCSQYIRYYNSYSYHMRVHNIKVTSVIDKTVFKPQCKFCPLKLTTIKMYNSHVSEVHRENLKTKITVDERAFQSILFKCAECNVFFLSANAAKRHSEHQEKCDNWKCSECERLFKMNDKLLHMKQHSLCKNIIAYDLCESALKRVLFKCLKCAVHFSEEEYFLHYTICDCETPDSAYCNVCDALINKNDMTLHEVNHKDQTLRLFDFTFIESDIIVNNVNKPLDKKNNPHAITKFALYYCRVCKCFVGDLGKTRKAHIEKRCGIICPRMCTKCGLIFTSGGYVSHKMLHDKIQNLSMQTYHFYDIVSKKRIRPPIPEYPQCNICKIHFLNKQVIKEHECIRQNYTVCNICKIKLTEVAFKLHLNFHKYKFTLFEKQSAKLIIEEPTTSTNNTESDYSKSTPIESLIPEVADSSNMNIHYLYTCIICDVTVEMYDKVIQHCHNHYDYCKGIGTSDSKQMQPNCRSDDKSSVIVKFDPFYIRFSNDIWIKHIFLNIGEEIVKNILEDSIYKFEGRFKMEEIQPGPINLVLYKCDVCRSYIEPNELYMHAKIPCITTKKHPCSICGLCFSSSNFQMIHEEVHRERPDINTTSYKIILYNKREHHLFTRIMIESHDKFILYQCRNCELIVDKLQRGIHRCQSSEVIKCSHCGLLFLDQEFISHVNKHKEFLYFKPEKMTLIMFGKLGPQKDNELKQSFDGTMYDLTFYKCINCGLCLKSKSKISKHVCVPKSYRTQCPKCYLSFLKKELHDHLQMHEGKWELSYEDFSSNVITFDLSASKTNTGNEIVHDSLKSNDNINKEETNANENTNIMQKIYKCHCGLHFLEDLNARRHFNNCSPKQKICKQRCFKCDLLFTPGELFDHLLKHHSDKKIRYKYDIINITEV